VRLFPYYLNPEAVPCLSNKSKSEKDTKYKRLSQNPIAILNGPTSRNLFPLTAPCDGISPVSLSKTYESEQPRAQRKYYHEPARTPRFVAQSLGRRLIVQRLAPPLATLVSRRLYPSHEARGVDNLSSSILAIHRPVRSIIPVGFAELGKSRDVTLVHTGDLLGRQGSGVAGDAARIGVWSVEQGVRRLRLVEGGSNDIVRRPCVERKGFANVANAAGVEGFGQESRGALVLALVGQGLGTIEDRWV
jgi:hypothetical protein